MTGKIKLIELKQSVLHTYTHIYMYVYLHITSETSYSFEALIVTPVIVFADY